MDAFFASVEQMDNPKLKGKPVIVCGEGARSVVSTCSYEARKYGVHSAMPYFMAKQLCPVGIFLPGRHKRYSQISKGVFNVLESITDIIEPVSIDEAYLDISGLKMTPINIVNIIKKRIKEKYNLTLSAGISYNKFLAKIASDYNKPNGLFVIPPQKGPTFIEQLSINKFFGVGRVTGAKMNELGIYNGADLKKWSEIDLAHHFGKAGLAYFQYARGLDNREVESERIRKSLGAEETFLEDLSNLKEIEKELDVISQEVAKRAKRREFKAKTLTLKVKYADFTIVTRSVTLSYFIESASEMLAIAMDLLSRVEDIELKKVRLLGLTLNPSCRLLP